MTVPAGPERRKEARHAKHLSVQIFDDQRSALPDAVMMDLSMNGLCIELSKKPPIGSTVSFRIHIPKHGPIAGFGKIRWTYEGKNLKYLCGIQFETLGWINQQSLRNYLYPHMAKRRPLEDLD